MIHFDRQYVYMYKAFTHPKHRGKRPCNPWVRSTALEALPGGLATRGSVSYVEGTTSPR